MTLIKKKKKKQKKKEQQQNHLPRPSSSDEETQPFIISLSASDESQTTSHFDSVSVCGTSSSYFIKINFKYM